MKINFRYHCINTTEEHQSWQEINQHSCRMHGYSVTHHKTTFFLYNQSEGMRGFVRIPLEKKLALD